MSIPFVSGLPSARRYALGMGEQKTKAPAWGSKLRAHLRNTDQSIPSVAEKMGLTEGGLRHWLNGTRTASVDEVLKLIKVSGADPRAILGIVTEETQAIDQIQNVLSKIRRPLMTGRPLGEPPPSPSQKKKRV